MNGEFRRYDLATADPFGISRGTSTAATAFVVRLSHEGTAGVGAGSPSEYYGETPADSAAALPDLLDFVERIGDPHAGQRAVRELAARVPDAPAARSAVATALADLAAGDLGVPLYRQWGLDPDAVPTSSYTVSIADPDEMAERAREAVAAGHSVLKVKLGTDEDRARLTAVREAAPDATIRVDANGAWDPETALANCEWLAAAGVELVEQPVPADDLEGLRRVTAGTDLPVAADEACVTAADVSRVADACDLVVVKLAKCGGLRPAIAQIHAAHAAGLDVMLGCMLESAAAIAPACHLAPLVEYADLDGALLLAEDPCEGVPMPGGRPDLQAVESGTGARLRDSW